MARWNLALTALLTLTLAGAWAQTPKPTPKDDQLGTYLGVLFSPLPEVLYAQLPDLPRSHGVLVNFVLPDSPAAKAGVQRYDVLLAYNDEKVRDCEHFAKLISGDKPDQKVKLEVLRAGRRQTVEAKLALGPALKLAEGTRSASNDAKDVPRGTAKPAGNGSVSMSARPLEGGQVRVTIEYYEDGTGLLQKLSCEGDQAKIESQIQKDLPPRLQPYAKAYLQKIFEQVFQLKSNSASPPPALRDTDGGSNSSSLPTRCSSPRLRIYFPRLPFVPSRFPTGSLPP